jgi:FMN phosphatase YigB (HAD superfamily)
MIRQMAAAVEKLDWDQIDTVLLDLDGTLLDLGFDNDFWLDFIPAVYAAAQALTVEQANACAARVACEGHPGSTVSRRMPAQMESELFWTAVREVEPFDSQRSLFVDDSPPVLRAAQEAGIRWVRGVRRASAARGGQGRPARDYGDIQAVDSVSDLDPGLPSTEGHRGGLGGAGQDPGPDSLPT